MMNQYAITWHNGKRSTFIGEKAKQSDLAFHIKTEGCIIIVPYAWYKDGTSRHFTNIFVGERSGTL